VTANINNSAKVYVAGHRGLVGSAIVRKLKEKGYTNIVHRTHAELDLTDYKAVRDLLEAEGPDVVFDAAARVGGIHANNTYPADFIRDNLFIQNNLIDCSYRAGVRKFVFLGSSCIYPKMAPQPLKEEYLLTGPLEPTNEWYAVAKIAGIKMCQAYRRQYGFDAISLMPTNLYGPGDNFDLETSHVMPALIRKFHEAKVNGEPSVTVWGTGTPRREFLHVNDMADAAVFLMETYSGEEFINIGVGEDISISDLVALVKDTIGYEGAITFDTSKPDGTPRKLMDTTRLAGTGWTLSITLRDGIVETYAWYLKHIDSARGVAHTTG